MTAVVSTTMSIHEIDDSSSSDQRVRVLLLFGGRSGEHAVSCATAAGVMQALDPSRYDVLPVGITPDGQWVEVDDDPRTWQIQGTELPKVPSADADVTLPLQVGRGEVSVTAAGQIASSLGRVDVVLPLLHGPYGEDGTLQGLLELTDLPYVGSGVLASAVGMDKHYMKIVLASAGLPVGPYVVLKPGQWQRRSDVWRSTIHNLGLPVFVKPARAGSSLGITKVDDWADLDTAIAVAEEHDPKVIIEAAVFGREIECAVLSPRVEGDPPRTSLPGEIVIRDSEHAFYDFEAKYLGEGDVELSCPADLPDDVTEQVRALAARSFDALSCEGLARVDTFVTDTGQVIINEVNTMPGFTPFSMYPVLWQRTGMEYGELVDELLQLALNRRRGLR